MMLAISLSIVLMNTVFEFENGLFEVFLLSAMFSDLFLVFCSVEADLLLVSTYDLLQIFDVFFEGVDLTVVLFIP